GGGRVGDRPGRSAGRFSGRRAAVRVGETRRRTAGQGARRLSSRTRRWPEEGAAHSYELRRFSDEDGRFRLWRAAILSSPPAFALRTGDRRRVGARRVG